MGGFRSSLENERFPGTKYGHRSTGIVFREDGSGFILKQRPLSEIL
jgi:hypothetical protein